jgi:AcrR family transcriptional regulator
VAMTELIWSKEQVEERFRRYVGDEADQSREAKKRRAILAAGYQLFLQHGYKKASVDEIAKKAHVAKGTVYLYFKNKAELLMHCVAFEKQIVKDDITKLFAPETPDRDRLRHWLKLSLYAARDMPLSSRLMTGDHELLDALDDAKNAEMDAMREEGAKLCMQLIEMAAPGALSDEEKRARVDVLQAMGYLSAHLLDPRIRSERPLAPFLDAMIEVLLHGVTHRVATAAGAAAE